MAEAFGEVPSLGDDVGCVVEAVDGCLKCFGIYLLEAYNTFKVMDPIPGL